MASKKLLEQIKQELNLKELKSTGRRGGGCINEGETYLTENGKLFLKMNSKSDAKLMFDGEMVSLKAIEDTGTIRVPKPYTVVSDYDSSSKKCGTSILVLEYLYFHGGGGNAALGNQLADLHLHNTNLKKLESRISHSSREKDSNAAAETRFGFEVTTCCGYIPQNNDWCDDWISFYTRKLDEQIKLLQPKGQSGRQANELWLQLQRIMTKFFSGVEVFPSLLHGDLWGGNVAQVETDNGFVPCIFDPASFYGHHEFDLAIASMFGGFNSSFWDAYFEKIPKAKGWEIRHELYQLFHYINHW